MEPEPGESGVEKTFATELQRLKAGERTLARCLLSAVGRICGVAFSLRGSFLAPFLAEVAVSSSGPSSRFLP